MRVYSLKEEVIKYGKTVCSTHAMKGGKIMIEDLKHKFDKLGDEEKIEFMKLIIPSFREIFRKSRKDDGRDDALLRGHDEVVRYGYAGDDENDGHDGKQKT